MRRGLPDHESVERLTESVKTLHVAVGHARLYGAEHRETIRAMEDALTGMGPLLEAWGAVELDSSQEGLSWRGEMVHPETEDLLGLGRLLHREGIATISLARGVDVAELGRLLEVLRINFELPEFEEETLESLLWQAGFQRVGFQAVTALMEAEALSGRIAAPSPDMDIEGISQRISELMVSSLRGGDRRNLGQISEEVVARAVAGSDLAGLGPVEESRQLQQEERAWRVQFAEEGTEDADLIAKMRAAVEDEESADLLARLVGVLMRAVLASRSELEPKQALVLARHAVEEIYRRGDPVGLVRILDEGTSLMEEPSVKASPRAGLVREFFANAVTSRRIARVLLSLDATRAGDDDLKRLVERLPDAVLQSVLEAASRDKDSRRHQRLRETLGVVVGGRVDAWLLDSMSQPPERVVPTIGLARSLGRRGASGCRSQLLTHPSRLVREEILRWYVDDLPDDDLRLVVPLVLDPHPAVRRATADVLVAHRPYEAVKWLRRLVDAPGFSNRPPDIKRDACVVFGLVGGDGAVESLTRLLSQKTKMMGTDPVVLADLEAASRGLAAVGSVAAKQALKRAGGGLFGPRKKLCAEAMRRLEEGKPW
jgi:hypothetical protein